MHVPHPQQGAAALAVTLVLFFIATLVAASAQRNHVFELRASANQYRATQAFEAAEAGLEWATAMLNDPRPLDAHCQPGNADDSSFADRLAVAPTVTATCVRNDGTWRCNCPAPGEPQVAAPLADDPPAAFSVRVAGGPAPGSLRLVATGCTRLDGGTCAPEGSASGDAAARIQQTLGFIPSPTVAPIAALTVRGSVAAVAAVGLHNSDTDSGGVAVHAGGGVVAPNARLTTAPGGPVEAAVVQGDQQLATLDGARFFASFFGIDKALWRQQPGVARIACSGDCGQALSQATLAARHRLLWIDGDLQLSGDVALGTRERPIVIVASGAVRLNGPVVVHGVLYGASLTWNHAGGGAIHGAALSEGDYGGDASPDFIRDVDVLATLKRSAGSFARLPGSWKDF
ncbi:pilus assembly PilX N-terminal domain-containing protein [Piscinibacter sp. XHJ-5]|uniref:pilus assembly PilX family protein n=1 Tax=Piscinibacter sp. XHJ-5 TaxID=3037797 RepID=UPI002452BA90|nr:pilus assembly PilX N-terminal domain-containing protein [Piscinibacter sp. XHJ-5]